MSWQKAQVYEKNWWGNCVNTLFEEEKQLIYAEKMGLEMVGNEKTPYVFDLKGASVLDIGGGPNSLLLKCINFSKAVVVDPINFPNWVIARYSMAGIKFWNNRGEDLNTTEKFNEIWLYNVLQHTQNPEKIIKNAKKYADIIRIFEWIDTPISDGHIHSLTEQDLNKWLGGYGKVEVLNRRPTVGKCFYGVFI
jgi:2-polyprenyl-3-methyl-5-hydroxy-6-metoxy-1,4-benzoquinol methylase